METDTSRTKIGPYSRTLDRGAIGASIDGRSREGRFLRGFESGTLKQLGSNPSFTQRVAISRLARIALRLELFDEALVNGKGLTDHDARVYGALHNSLRLLLKEIGLKATMSPAPSLRDYVASKATKPGKRLREGAPC